MKNLAEIIYFDKNGSLRFLKLSTKFLKLIQKFQRAVILRSLGQKS